MSLHSKTLAIERETLSESEYQEGSVSPKHSMIFGDPKLWPKWLRYSVFANICFFVWLSNVQAAAIATCYISLRKDFGLSVEEFISGISWSLFALGMANFFWTPLAYCIGKRPAILLSLAVFLAGSIWCACAQTYSSFLAARIVGSFGAGSVEALGSFVVGDLFFEKHYSTATGIYSFFLAFGAATGPVLGGVISQHKDWRWVLIFISILAGSNLLCSVFICPETTYRRVILKGETAAKVDEHAIEAIEDVEKFGLRQVRTTKPETHTDRGYWADLVHFKGRSQEERGLKGFPKQFSLPFRFLFVPVILWGVILYGVAVTGIITITSVASPLYLTAPPYNFNSTAQGLYGLTGIIGVAICYPIAGPVTDWMSALLGRRNGGVHEPEHRLPSLLFPSLIAPSGLILYGWAMGHQKSYVISAVGQSMQNTGLVFIPSVLLTYAIDAYPVAGGEALVLINGGKALVAFGVNYVSGKWLKNQGVANTFYEFAALQWGVLIFAVPLYFWGPWLRRMTAGLI